MRIEMGIGRNREAPQAQAVRNVGLDEITGKNGDEEGVVFQHHQERRAIESRKGHDREEIETSQGRDAGVFYVENYVPFPEEKKRRATQLQLKTENACLEEEDYKAVLDRPRSSHEGKDFIASNCQDVNRADSRSRNTYVKLWANKESQRNDQTPKRIKVQIGSLSCGDTVRFLEAEKARVIGEIQEEQEKRLGCGRDTKVLIGTREKAYKEVEDTNGMAMFIADDTIEGQALQPMTEEHKRAEDRPAEIKEKQRTERDQTCSQEMRSLSISEGKVKQKAEKELRAIHDNKAQHEAKTACGVAQEEKPVEVLRLHVTPAREHTHPRGQKRASSRPAFDTVKKIDRRTIDNSRDSNSYKPFQGDKWSARCDKFVVGSAEADKGRVVAKQGVDDEKELQKKAIFHLDALKRIEETYNKRKRKEKSDYLWANRANEMLWYHSGYNRDHNYLTGFHETQANQRRIPQNRGRGGLNALLAPVFEDELERQFEDDPDENSPTNSVTNKKVVIFQRIKKAQLRAAQEQIAAAKARGQQIRAQKKTRPEKAEKVKGPERELVVIKERNIGGECFKPPKANLPPNQTEGRFLTYTPSAKRIKALNEKARAEAEVEQERRKRAKVKQERMARLRPGPHYAAVELYGRLNRDERRAKMGPTIGFKSPVDMSQKLNGFGRFKHVELSPQRVNTRVNSRFKSPPASPRKAMKANALEHFANWEKELRCAQRSNCRSKERSREMKVTIIEDPTQNSGKRRSPVPRSRSVEKISISNKPSPRNKSPVIVLTTEPIPDHYSSVGKDCKCESRTKKDKNRIKDVRIRESPKGSRRKEACKSLNWLGKLYNTITSFS